MRAIRSVDTGEPSPEAGALVEAARGSSPQSRPALKPGGAGRPPHALLVWVALVVLLVTACGGSGKPSSEPAPGPPIQNRTLNVDGVPRTYRLCAPATLDRSRPAPLVLVLGAVGNSVEGMVQATQFDRTAKTGDFLVAYPAGINETWNAGYCCQGREPTGPDDVAFSLGSSTTSRPTTRSTRLGSSSSASPSAG